MRGRSTRKSKRQTSRLREGWGLLAGATLHGAEVLPKERQTRELIHYRITPELSRAAKRLRLERIVIRRGKPAKRKSATVAGQLGAENHLMQARTVSGQWFWHPEAMAPPSWNRSCSRQPCGANVKCRVRAVGPLAANHQGPGATIAFTTTYNA